MRGDRLFGLEDGSRWVTLAAVDLVKLLLDEKMSPKVREEPVRVDGRKPFSGGVSKREASPTRLAWPLALAFAALLAVGCRSAPPGSTPPGRAEAGGGDAGACGHVEDGTACAPEGLACTFTGPITAVAPVARPGTPPTCFCSGGVWACPHVAAP